MKFISLTYIMMDIIPHVTKLSLFFPKGKCRPCPCSGIHENIKYFSVVMYEKFQLNKWYLKSAHNFCFSAKSKSK